jgi:hypothetical protein
MEGGDLGSGQPGIAARAWKAIRASLRSVRMYTRHVWQKGLLCRKVET